MKRDWKRVVWAVVILAAAFLIAPAAAPPGVNSADLIVLATPFLFVWAVLPWLVGNDRP